MRMRAAVSPGDMLTAGAFHADIQKGGTMKRAVRTIVTAGCLAAVVAGCGSGRGPAQGRLIVTSFYPVYITALNVVSGVDGVGLVNLVQSQAGCLHDHQMSPAEMALVEHAGVLVINGAGMEPFMDAVRKSRPELAVIDVSEEIELLPSWGHGTGGEVDHDHDHQAAYNPHVWVGISNAMLQAETMAEGLARWDTANAAAYRENGRRYAARLDSLRRVVKSALDSCSRRDIITQHDAFAYFAREFGLTVAGVVAREAGAEPSAEDLAGTIRTIREKKIAAVFAEPQYSDASARTIARETGVRVLLLDPGSSGPMNPDAYVETMGRNAAVLAGALK